MVAQGQGMLIVVEIPKNSKPYLVHSDELNSMRVVSYCAFLLVL